MGQLIGVIGENLVADHYVGLGYDVLERNWRTPSGEIDLVLSSQSAYVFCEVKTRTSLEFGHPAESVSRAKRNRIRRLAMGWLEENSDRFSSREVRFDVATVLPDPNRLGEWVVDIILGAF